MANCSHWCCAHPLPEPVRTGLPAMTASKSTNPQRNTPDPIVGASLLAKTAYQPTNLQLNTHGQIVGAGLPAMAACQPTNLPPECTHSNCGSELARESGLPDDIKTTGAIPVLHTHTINASLQSRLKYTNRYAIQATTPCAVTYAYARIRRLTRLWAGLYRFPVTENQ